MTRSSKEPKKASHRPRGLVVFTESGTVPRWISAARFVLVLALAASIPTVLGVEPGRRLFWAAAIASLPVFWVVGGFHLWRRLCPLAVFSQSARLLGVPGQRRVSAQSLLGRHYFAVQLGLMVLALSLRLIMTNGTPWALAGFLIAVVVLAVSTGFVFTGKTWCNFVCPVGMVEKIYTEPARLSGPTTSQCTPCTACKKNCPDIDLEQGYWKELDSPSRRWAYFAWPGVVLGFYLYFYLRTGGWDFYFSGAWTLEDAQIARWLGYGFYFMPEVPMFLAAPATLLVCGFVSALVFAGGERLARRLSAGGSAELVRHRSLALAGFVAFLTFYYFGGQPTVRMLPGWFGALFATAVTVAATAIFVRRWRRRESDFVRERFAEKLVKKWEWDETPPSSDLSELYLVHHERKKERESRLGAYKETVREMVADGLITRNELALLGSLRAQLGITDKDHERVLAQLGEEDRRLFDDSYQGSVERRVQEEQYRQALGGVIRGAASAGVPASEAELEAVRREYRMDLETHQRAVGELRGDAGPLAEMARAELAEVRMLGAAMAAAQVWSKESRSVALLGDLCRARAASRVRRILATRGVRLAGALAGDLCAKDEASYQRAVAELRGTSLGELEAEILAAVASVRQPQARDSGDDALRALANDSDKALRAIAVHLLSRLDDDNSREVLTSALDDEAALVRESAAHALSVRGRLRGDAMAKVVGDPDPRVRRAAVSVVRAGGNGGQGGGVFATFDSQSHLGMQTMLERMALIRGVALFARLDPADLEAVADLMSERHIDAGEHLCRQGEVDDDVFIVVEGEVEARARSGEDTRTLGRSGPGSCIGEMAAVDRAPRSADVVAIVPTRALVLPGAELRNLLATRASVAQGMLEVVVARLRQAL